MERVGDFTRKIVKRVIEWVFEIHIRMKYTKQIFLQLDYSSSKNCVVRFNIRKTTCMIQFYETTIRLDSTCQEYFAYTVNGKSLNLKIRRKRRRDFQKSEGIGISAISQPAIRPIKCLTSHAQNLRTTALLHCSWPSHQVMFHSLPYSLEIMPPLCFDAPHRF